MTLTGVLPRATIGADGASWLTLYIALLFLVPSKLVFGPLGSAGSPAMLLGIASLIIWVLSRASAPRSFALGANPIRIALGVFAFSAGISYAIAMANPINSDEISPADVALLAIASWCGTTLTAHDGISTRQRLDTLVWRVVVCGSAIALLGIAQVLTGQLWIDQISIPGLSSTQTSGLAMRGAFVRPSGTAIHPIEFGVVITMLLPLALHVGFNHVHRNALLRWIPAVSLAAVIPLTSSRSAYLGAVIGLSICLIYWPPMRRLVMVGVAAVGVAAMTVITPNLFNSVVGLFTGVSNDPSIASRTGSFDLAFHFIVQNPWFGRGLGTFLPKYRIFDNQYLGLLVTGGIIGTAAFIALGVVAIVCLLRLRARTIHTATRDLSVSLVAATAVGFACLVMFDAFAFPMTMGCLFLLLGVAGCLRRLERESPILLSSIR
jgi:O-antigen ligase